MRKPSALCLRDYLNFEILTVSKCRDSDARDLSATSRRDDFNVISRPRYRKEAEPIVIHKSIRDFNELNEFIGVHFSNFIINYYGLFRVLC